METLEPRSEGRQLDDSGHLQHKTLTESVVEDLLTSYPKIYTPVGIAMVAASIVLMVMAIPFPFAITALAWGSTIIALDRYFRYKVTVRRIETHEVLTRLEQEDQKWDRRQALLEKTIEQGLPEGLTWSEFASLVEAPEADDQSSLTA